MVLEKRVVGKAVLYTSRMQRLGVMDGTWNLKMKQL